MHFVVVHSSVIDKINMAFLYGLYPTTLLQGWTNIFGLFQKLNQYMYFTLVKCFTPYVRSNK